MSDGIKDPLGLYEANNTKHRDADGFAGLKVFLYVVGGLGLFALAAGLLFFGLFIR